MSAATISRTASAPAARDSSTCAGCTRKSFRRSGIDTDLGLATLVETHSDEDLVRAAATDAPVIGVYARDLESLEVDVEGALVRLARVPADRIGVLESGVAGRGDVDAALDAGASAILVGEALMRADDPARAVRKLLWRELRT